jgi:hypothetical protein
MQENPYLSIVAASRNDGHGGDIEKRMHLFVNGLIIQANRYQFQIELIIVEWNPPSDRPLLQHILPKPQPDDYLQIRYILVPAFIHNRYRRCREIPLFQMIAKNAGIRRAKGKFILCTNVDLIFSDTLFAFMASKKLRNDTFYRANRCDVTDGIMPDWNFEDQLDWCNKNTIRRLGMDPRFKNINLEQMGLNDKSWFKKWLFNKLAFFMTLFWPSEKRHYYQIDSFACGDFTLMARETWMAIKGYIELDLYSIHIDTLALISAAALGYKQYVLPLKSCTYHIDHTMGWASMNPMEKIKFLEERPGVDYGMVFEAGIYALKQKQPFNLNAPDWGFASEKFDEYVFPVNRG